MENGIYLGALNPLHATKHHKDTVTILDLLHATGTTTILDHCMLKDIMTLHPLNASGI